MDSGIVSVLRAEYPCFGDVVIFDHTQVNTIPWTSEALVGIINSKIIGVTVRVGLSP